MKSLTTPAGNLLTNFTHMTKIEGFKHTCNEDLVDLFENANFNEGHCAALNMTPMTTPKENCAIKEEILRRMRKIN